MVVTAEDDLGPVSYNMSMLELTLPAERHDARVAVRRRKMRVQADLRREVVQRDALRLEKGDTAISSQDRPSNSQDITRLLGADPDYGAQVELLEEGEVELGRLRRAVESCYN